MGMRDDAMAEEKSDECLTSVLVQCTYFISRLGNTLHVALIYLTCAECQTMQTSVNGGNRARHRVLSLA